jgi:hypothetical protein
MPNRSMPAVTAIMAGLVCVGLWATTVVAVAGKSVQPDEIAKIQTASDMLPGLFFMAGWGFLGGVASTVVAVLVWKSNAPKR